VVALCTSLLLGSAQPAAADTVVRYTTCVAAAAVVFMCNMQGPTTVVDHQLRMCRVPINPDPGVFAAQRTLLEAWRIVTDSYEDSTFNGRDWVHTALASCKGILQIQPSDSGRQRQVWHVWLPCLQEQDLADSLIATSAAASPEKAYQQIEQMLSHLDDPYTRILPPRYAAHGVSCCLIAHGWGMELLMLCAAPLCVHDSCTLCRDFQNFRIGSDGEIQGVGLMIAQVCNRRMKRAL
jgi:hypothetical protein